MKTLLARWCWIIRYLENSTLQQLKSQLYTHHAIPYGKCWSISHNLHFPGLVIRHTEEALGKPSCEVLLDRRGPCQMHYETLCPLEISQGVFQVRAGCYDGQCDSQGKTHTGLTPCYPYCNSNIYRLETQFGL